LQINNDFYFNNFFFHFIIFHFDKKFNIDSEILYSFYETIENRILDRKIKSQFDQQLEKFKKAQGMFGRSMTIDTSAKKQPSKAFS